MKKEIKATRILEKNLQASKSYKILINEGGTGSSKTISLCQFWALKLSEEENKILTIVRKTTPALKKTVMRDFLSVLNQMGLYNEANYNKTDSEYRLGTNLIEFISLDQPQKKRGSKRDYLWCNEGNELVFEDYFQLSIRTKSTIIFDYNPSDEYHWIYDNLLGRDDSTVINSTYMDNPFLDNNIVQEIERYKKIDLNYWNIYGLGIRGKKKTIIYQYGMNWVTEMFDIGKIEGDEFYGMDFGVNDPTVLIRMKVKDGVCYERKVFYQSGWTNKELMDNMESQEIDKNTPIYADCEDKNRIMEIKEKGYNIIPSVKGKHSVKDGIDYVKRYKVILHPEDEELTGEKKKYSWKLKNEQLLNEPVKIKDHGQDAERYALFTHFKGFKSSGLFGFYSNTNIEETKDVENVEKKETNESIIDKVRRYSVTGINLNL